VDERVFVIVGASLAGAKAAEALREAGFAGKVVLIGEETDLPYERPPLSKGYLLGDAPREGAQVHDAEWYRQQDIDLRLGARVTNLDPAGHTVTVDGVTEVHYDKLLLTTGSRVRRLDVPGGDLPDVRYLRTQPDSDALLDRLRGGAQRVVVIGAGWIGLETAAAARHYGASVTVVEMETLPLRWLLGDEVATFYADLHRRHGVEFRFGTGVREFRGSDRVLTGVVLTDGTEVPADLAIVGIGITPATELAVAGGLAVDNGIAVDAALRTSDPDVYAAGDVASVLNPLLGKRIRVEHWANALNGGPAAARSMAGADEVYDPVPYFFSDQYDLGMEYAGFIGAGGCDEVVFRGDPAAGEFIAFWLKDGRVLAGMNANVWDVTDDIQALVRAGYGGKPVDRARLADPSVPLPDLLT